MTRTISRCIFSLSAAIALSTLLAATARAITIPTVLIGNPGNPPPEDIYGNDVGFGGAVAYEYRIGTTEVTNAQYVAFLNAVAATDTYGLYNTGMGSDTRGGITRTGSSGAYSYSVKADAGSYTYAQKPVDYVSWGDSARFTNWLSNGQPTGAEDANTTEDGAYRLNGATTDAALNAVVRNWSARWFVPNIDEWNKAAYYDANANTYNGYPSSTGSAFPDNNPPSLDSGNSANFFVRGVGVGFTTGDGNYPLTDVGAYTLSASAYGTFDQGGNVQEWNEALVDGGLRHVLGGSFNTLVDFLHIAFQPQLNPTSERSDLGFRVVTVPEPGTAVLAIIGFALTLWWNKGRK